LVQRFVTVCDRGRGGGLSKCDVTLVVQYTNCILKCKSVLMVVTKNLTSTWALLIELNVGLNFSIKYPVLNKQSERHTDSIKHSTHCMLAVIYV
jgi:hypothetical protein